MTLSPLLLSIQDGICVEKQFRKLADFANILLLSITFKDSNNEKVHEIETLPNYIDSTRILQIDKSQSHVEWHSYHNQ